MGTTLGLCSGLLLAGKTDKINAAYTYYTLAKNSKVVNRHGKKVAKNAKAGTSRMYHGIYQIKGKRYLKFGRNRYVLKRNAVINSSNETIKMAKKAPLYSSHGKRTDYEPLTKGETYYALGAYTLGHEMFYKVSYDNSFVKASDVVGYSNQKSASLKIC